MNKILVIITTMLKKTLIHRENILMELILSAVPTLILIILYNSILSQEDLKYTITYLIIGRFIYTILNPNVHWDINSQIKSGEIIIHMLRPISQIKYWFLANISQRLITLMLGIVPFSIMLFVFRSNIYFIHAENILPFILSVITSSIILFLIYYMLSVLSYRFHNITAIFYTSFVVIEFLSGAIVPLKYFGKIGYIVSNFLPFKYIVDFPMNIYTNSLTFDDQIFGILVSGIWIIVILISTLFIEKRYIKMYSVVGI